MSKEQGAGFYRFKIGEFEVASVSDGFLQFDNPKTMIAAGATEKEFQAFMESKFLPSTTAYFQINTLYVDTGKHKVLGETWGRSPRFPDDVQSDYVHRVAASITPRAAHGNEVNVPAFFSAVRCEFEEN